MMRSVLGVACALALGACSGWMPSWDLGLSGITSGGSTELRIESDPPGAEARTSTGQACRTPCAVVVPAATQNVTFTLAGFIPQTVPVLVRVPVGRVDPEASTGAELVPNPLAVTLEQAPPPPTRRRQPVPKQRAVRPPPPPAR